MCVTLASINSEFVSVESVAFSVVMVTLFATVVSRFATSAFNVFTLSVVMFAGHIGSCDIKVR